ncbi:MAG: hypothetical protein AB1646_21955 [Thermodesulfobacteriota bacterium]
MVASVKAELSLLEAELEALPAGEICGRGLFRVSLGKASIWLCEVGIGITSAALALGALMSELRPDRVIMVGSAGALPGSGLHLGDVVAVTSETLAELGLCSGPGIGHAEALGLPSLEQEVPLDAEFARALQSPALQTAPDLTLPLPVPSRERKRNPPPLAGEERERGSTSASSIPQTARSATLGDEPSAGGGTGPYPDTGRAFPSRSGHTQPGQIDSADLPARTAAVPDSTAPDPAGGRRCGGEPSPAVRGRTVAGRCLTVVGVSADESTARARAARFGTIAENMEGYALAVACRRFGVPGAEVRGISNQAGIRDKSAWNLELANERAQLTVLNYLRSIS